MANATTKVEIQSTNIPISFAGTATDAALNIHYHLPVKADPSLPTVVLLPFWGGSAGTYSEVLECLGAARPSRICVSVSYRGTGESTRHGEGDTPKDHDIPQLASDVVAVLESDALHKLDLLPSGKVVLVAHSMSAKVAWYILSTLASRNLAVARLLLLAPAPVGPLVLPDDMAQQQLTAYSSLGSAGWTVQNVLTSKPLGDTVISRLAADCVGMSPQAKRGWIQHGMKMDCTDVVRTVESHSLKIGVVVGQDDKVETVPNVQKTVDVLQSAGFDTSLRVIHGCGHLLPVEAPQEVVEELVKMF